MITSMGIPYATTEDLRMALFRTANAVSLEQSLRSNSIDISDIPNREIDTSNLEFFIGNIKVIFISERLLSYRVLLDNFKKKCEVAKESDEFIGEEGSLFYASNMKEVESKVDQITDFLAHQDNYLDEYCMIIIKENGSNRPVQVFSGLPKQIMHFLSKTINIIADGKSVDLTYEEFIDNYYYRVDNDEIKYSKNKFPDCMPVGEE